MNLSRAVSHMSHYQLLQSKLKSLEIELNEALKCQEETDKETAELEAKLKENTHEFKQKKSDMVRAFGDELDEYSKQVKYFEELLKKKTEERDAQLAYLSELNVCERSHEDLVGFNWSTLKKIACNGENNAAHERQYQKAVEASIISEAAQLKLEKLLDLVESTEDARYGVITRIKDIYSYNEKWKREVSEQQRRIRGHESENYRLSLIVKQCISNDEPISENITRNVRDKCHSFINSTNIEELVQGLKKYHKRQENKIKLLKRKVNKLSQELSHLQVASDQTADLIQHYLTMIHANSNRLLAYNPSRIPPPQEV